MKTDACVCERERVTLKMRSLLSETRARPPLKWTAHVSRRTVTATPTALTAVKIGNLTTGGVAIFTYLERENGRERERDEREPEENADYI